MSAECKPPQLWLVWSPTHKSGVIIDSDVRVSKADAQRLAKQRNNGTRTRETDWQVVPYRVKRGWESEP